MPRRGENPGEQESMCKIKYELNMVGLRTQGKERVLLLEATKRPSDPLPERFFHSRTLELFLTERREVFVVFD